MRISKLDLNQHLDENDLKLLRSKNRNKRGENTIVTRSLELVLKAKEGDIEARNTLYLLHTPLFRNLINRQYYTQPEYFDDCLHDCFEILIKAIDTFDPNKSDNFVAWLQLLTRNAFINKGKRNSLVYDREIKLLDDEKYDSNLLSKEDHIEWDIRNELELTEEENVIKNDLLNNETLSNIAKKYRSSKKEIKKIKNNIGKKMLKKRLNGKARRKIVKFF